MTDTEYLNIALASLHVGGWFTWKTEDADGNKIAAANRMTYDNVVVTKEGISKPTLDVVNAKIQELKDAETNAVTKKASGKQKLKDLGLNDDEIQALIGG
tara:strand:- start:76 stop:375 length:300 start_codon:yes stop_codon:yes gene_type:complete